jgi:hypothetical protein
MNRDPYQILWDMREIKANADYSKFEKYCGSLTKGELEELLSFAEVLVEFSKHKLAGFELLAKIVGTDDQ